MTEAKRERPGPMAEWNQTELCHWLRLVDLAEAAAMIEALAGQVAEARAVACLWRCVAREEATDLRIAAMLDASEALEWLVQPDRQAP